MNGKPCPVARVFGEHRGLLAGGPRDCTDAEVRNWRVGISGTPAFSGGAGCWAMIDTVQSRRAADHHPAR